MTGENRLNEFLSRRGIFVTGTDTDIGKTFVSGQIVKYLRERSIDAGYYKPVLSGAEKDNGKYIPGDVKEVCHTAGLEVPYERLFSYMYENPVSPHLASQLEVGCCYPLKHSDVVFSNPSPSICSDVICSHYSRLCIEYEFMVVEGCGGLLCPLRVDEASTVLLPSVIKALKLDIIIVADAGLGTLNSILLTVEAARQRDIDIFGVVLNRFEKGNIVHEDNTKQIQALTDLTILACVPQRLE